MVIILYMSCLAMISLTQNSITELVTQYLASIALALLLLIFFVIYTLVWVRPYRLFELYKINNLFRVIGLAILPINRYEYRIFHAIDKFTDCLTQHRVTRIEDSKLYSSYQSYVYVHFYVLRFIRMGHGWYNKV